MPIDVEKAMSAKLPTETLSWNEDQVILYHLGIGAGVPCTDPGELAYTYESQLKVLPTFAVVPCFQSLVQITLNLGANLAMVVHGEQKTILHRPLPSEATLTTVSEAIAVYDKGPGKGAVVVVEAKTVDERGAPVFDNVFSVFLRGAGGFGGARGPEAPRSEIPSERAPDFEITETTTPEQALLYRLSGDYNPLHADPGFANAPGADGIYGLDDDYARLVEMARDRLGISLQVLPAGPLPAAGPKPFFALLDRTLSSELRKHVQAPFWIEWQAIGASGVEEGGRVTGTLEATGTLPTFSDEPALLGLGDRVRLTTHLFAGPGPG